MQKINKVCLTSFSDIYSCLRLLGVWFHYSFQGPRESSVLLLGSFDLRMYVVKTIIWELGTSYLVCITG